MVSLSIKTAMCIEFSLKAKGKAEAKWSETHGKTTVHYHSKYKYFSIKNMILAEQKDKLYVMPPGQYVYPFTFQIPPVDLPTSFRSSTGKIIYTLEATLNRSMWIDSKDTKEFTFISKTMMNTIPGLMTPQQENTFKKLCFSSGTVSMNIHTEKMGHFQGEAMKVVAIIQNNSSRMVKPKYLLYLKLSYFCKEKRKLKIKEILKEKGDSIPPSTSQTVTKLLVIPGELGPSILNCCVIKREYRLKVSLDVPYAIDPKVKFPVVILPVVQPPTAGQQLLQFLMWMARQPNVE